MGCDSNNIGNSPVDMLHTLWGELCKNMCGFHLAVTQQIGNILKRVPQEYWKLLIIEFQFSLKSTKMFRISNKPTVFPEQFSN